MEGPTGMRDLSRHPGDCDHDDMGVHSIDPHLHRSLCMGVTRS